MLAYSNAGNRYKQQGAMTASPGELTLMLYNGAIKNLKLASLAIGNNEYIKTNEVLQKAQAILAELMGSLDMNYEISKQLLSLYDYMISEIVMANVKKDAARLDVVLDLLIELRDTWQQAILIQRQQTVVGKVMEA